MFKDILAAATLLVLFTFGVLIGVYLGVDGSKTAAVTSGSMSHNGQLYQVVSIRPREE